MAYYHCSLATVLGEILLVKQDQDLIAVSLFPKEHEILLSSYAPMHRPECFTDEIRQLIEYFAGKRTSFDLQFRMQGTPFQHKVWQALASIPYGETRSYGQIAAMIGQPKAVRAVGQANRRNPLPIIIPCHRVTDGKGRCIGYGGNHIDMQRLLLQLEQGGTL